MKEEKSIKDLLNSVFKSYNQGYKYEETSVINSWDQIVGSMIAKNTTKIFINKKVLYLTLECTTLSKQS